MNINKLLGVLIVVWCIILGLLLHLREDTRTEEGKITTSVPDQLQISFLDVGQGDATFITFADGQQMLIDCAIDARILEALGRTMPFYDRSIDYLVVTHPDQDHYGGCIDVIDRFNVGTIIYSGFEKEDTLFYHAFIDAVQESTADYIEIDEPLHWQIASTTLSFLYPVQSVKEDPDVPGYETETGSNNSSIVLLFDHGDTEILLTGDAEEELEEFLLQMYGSELDVDILKAGHHGSNSSSIEPFVETTSPSHVVFSAGVENRYGHPSARVLKRFERAASTIWRTDTMGDILIVVDHDQVTINNQAFDIDRSNNDN